MSRDQPTITDKVAFLSKPAAYPGKPPDVEVIETHMSWIFLTTTEVYKLKKPIRLDEMNCSTVSARQLNCQNEVRLNRRLAADVYLGVTALTREKDGSLRLGGKGIVVDWLVHMRRLPADRMLDKMINRHSVDQALLHKAAARLCRFYANAVPVNISAAAYRQRFSDNIASHAGQLTAHGHRLPQPLVDNIRERLLDFITRHGPWLDERIKLRHIIEAHGDLRPEHVCLVEPPMIIDCLEFSKTLRCLDPLDELAYFSIECEMAGDAGIGDFFVDFYKKHNHDDAPDALCGFYRCYRSLLRAYLAARHLRDDPQQKRRNWLQQAEGFLQLGQKYSLLW